MNIYLKKCKRCGQGFDIGINFEICPNCRRKVMDDLNENEKGVNENGRKN